MKGGHGLWLDIDDAWMDGRMDRYKAVGVNIYTYTYGSVDTMEEEY